MNETITEALLNEKAAAQVLGCSVAMMRKMRLFGNGPNYYKLRRLVRYSPADLQSYMDACRVEVK
jgi:hypothetical protein